MHDENHPAIPILVDNPVGPERIRLTPFELEAMAPAGTEACHCTGEKAVCALSEYLIPGFQEAGTGCGCILNAAAFQVHIGTNI
jgi:hypothetical protein